MIEVWDVELSAAYVEIGANAIAVKSEVANNGIVSFFLIICILFLY